MQNWEDLDTIQFYKTTRLYLEDDTLEDSTYQLHTYVLYPDMNGKYSWKEDDKEFEVVYDNGFVMMNENGKDIALSETNIEKYKLSFLGAQFVICLPFKLNDPGVQLSYEGSDIFNGRQVEVLKASYNAELDNHTKSHDWWHYFDKKTYKYLGYKVYHSPTYAKVYNIGTADIQGVTFPEYRRTYRVDADDNELYLRAEFWYSFED